MSDRIIETEYSECMKQSYIDYSMSVITARALPDVRDGLKPVQRRTLYAMYELGLRHDRPHRKCARIVGDTMGKYHPHGDASVYDALVVMAQDFKRNEPLAEPHGNFGSIEGDDSAAMRYTEARLQKLTEEVYLADLDKNVVDFVPNFDETEQEPTVLPVRIPNLLVNGAEGIAVGMATSIPSHNLAETIDGMIALIDHPELTSEELLQYIPGPDFATGGIVINQKDLPRIYAAGTGKIKLRGRVEFEPAKGRGGKDKLVVTEIPYTMVGEGIHRFLADVGSLAETRKLPEVTDIANESSKEGIRIVLELKKGSDVERIKNILYKKTKLEDTFGVNMLAIVDGRPETLSLKGILQHSLDFQVEINTRKYHNLLEKEQQRREIQEGLIRAVDLIDLIIEIIRGSKTQQQARACLMGQPSQVTFRTARSEKQAKKLCFTERQAQAILDLRLSKLIGLEILALEKEHEETVKNIARYEKILGSDRAMKNAIRKDLENIKREFGKPRKTVIADAQEAAEVKEEIQEQDVVFAMDRFGYVKVCDVAAYEKSGQAMEHEYRYLFVCKNTDRILLFTDQGLMHQVKVTDIPFQKWKDKGVPVDNLSRYDSKKETILYVTSRGKMAGKRLLFVTCQGYVKQTESGEFDTANRTVRSTKLTEGDRLVYVEQAAQGGQMVLQTETGYFLKFPAEEAELYKKTAVGVKGITLSAGDHVKHVYQLGADDDSAAVLYEGRELDLRRMKLASRGQKGTKPRKGKGV